MPLPPSLTCVCVFSSPIQRVTFKYDGSTIVPGEQGAEYQDFIRECTGRETRLRGQFLILRAIVYAGGGGAAEAKLGGAWPPRVPLALEEPDLRFLKACSSLDIQSDRAGRLLARCSRQDCLQKTQLLCSLRVTDFFQGSTLCGSNLAFSFPHHPLSSASERK